MAFLTFILLTCYHLAHQQKSFTPETIGYIYSKTVLLWFLEATLLRAVFYLLNMGAFFFELVAYSGYKFVM